MQLKKHNWQLLRRQTPCLQCGHNHETRVCLKRRKAKRVKA